MTTAMAGKGRRWGAGGKGVDGGNAGAGGRAREANFLVGAGGGNDERGGSDSTRWGVVNGSEPDSGSNDGSSLTATTARQASRRDALELEAWWGWERASAALFLPAR